MDDLFEICCFKYDGKIEDICKLSYEIDTATVDLLVRLEGILGKLQISSYESPILACFLDEITETYDGIRILHGAHNIQASFPLVRKIFELYLQAKFLLQNDNAGVSENEKKAVAYSAYYISRKNKGKIPQNKIDIYQTRPIFEDYIKKADEAYGEKPKFYEWFTIYDDKLRGFKNLADILGDADLYKNFYSSLSQYSHGYLTRDNIQYDSEDRRNYLREYHHPQGIVEQVAFCQCVITQLIDTVTSKYHLSHSCFYKKLEKNKEILDRINVNYKKLISNRSSIQTTHT